MTTDHILIGSLLRRLFVNSLSLGLFYLAAAWSLWELSSVMNPHYSGRIHDEFTANLLIGLIFPYSSVLCGFLTPRSYPHAASHWKIYLSNPFPLFSALLLFWGNDGWIFFITLAVLSVFVCRATLLERPKPSMQINLTDLDERFTSIHSPGYDPWDADIFASKSAFWSNFPLLAALMVISAPISALVLLILSGVMLGSFIFAFFSPGRSGPIFEQITVNWLTFGTLFTTAATGGPLLLRPAVLLFNIGRRLSRKQKIMKDQKRAVYLRRFVYDRRKGLWSRGFIYDLLRAIPGFAPAVDRATQATMEYRVIRALQGAASFVAIGKPDEKIPPLGAARVYVPDAA